MRFVNYPRYVAPDAYARAIEAMVERLRQEDGLVSIYQIGHISTPGISDIDLVVVFEDERASPFDPLKTLSGAEHYLFTHSLEGASRFFFQQAQRYTFAHNYRLLWGESLDVARSDLGEAERARLKRHIAIEFLVTSYISRTVDQVYGIVSVRNLLLSVNALRYDMEFLNITSGKLYDLIHTLVGWRKVWFEQPVGGSQLKQWYTLFYDALGSFLTALFEKERLFLPEWTRQRYARHIAIEHADHLGFHHEGTVPPGVLGVLGKKYVRLLNRVNTFTFFVPVTTQHGHAVLTEYFNYQRDAKRYNAKNLRGFSVHGSPLAQRLT